MRRYRRSLSISVIGAASGAASIFMHVSSVYRFNVLMYCRMWEWSDRSVTPRCAQLRQECFGRMAGPETGLAFGLAAAGKAAGQHLRWRCTSQFLGPAHVE